MKNTEKITDIRLQNLKPWKKGVSANPSGRPKGQRNYVTIYKEALIKLGTEKGLTPKDIEIELVQSGIKYANKGNYPFYKDILDRMYGSVNKDKEADRPINIAVILNSYE